MTTLDDDMRARDGLAVWTGPQAPSSGLKAPVLIAEPPEPELTTVRQPGGLPGAVRLLLIVGAAALLWAAILWSLKRLVA